MRLSVGGTEFPECQHDPRGIVKAGDWTGAHASAAVCDLPECIQNARRWAEAIVGVPADAFKPYPSKISDAARYLDARLGAEVCLDE